MFGFSIPSHSKDGKVEKPPKFTPRPQPQAGPSLTKRSAQRLANSSWQIVKTGAARSRNCWADAGVNTTKMDTRVMG